MLIFVCAGLQIRRNGRIANPAQRDNLELTLAAAPKAEYGKAGLWEVGIVQSDAVEGEDGLDEVVEADALDERGAVVVNPGFSTFGNLIAERAVKIVDKQAGVSHPYRIPCKIVEKEELVLLKRPVYGHLTLT